MRRYLLSRLFFWRGRQLALCVLLAGFSSALWAAPPDKPKAKTQPPPSAPPEFAPGEFRSEYLAALTVTSPFTPRIGSWSALASLYAGTNPEIQVWSLRGIFSTKPGRTNVGAASLFLSGTTPAAPLVELAMLQAGDSRDCWTLLNTDELRPFPEYFLEEGIIRDQRGIANGSPEYEAYWQVLVQAHYTSPKAFTKAARHDVTYVHLFNEPAEYRGQVVHVSGRLVRLLRFDPPDEARAAGVSNLYEGWLITDAYGENPVCVVFTDLPSGLKISGDGRMRIEDVAFDGYSYKRYRYKAYDSKKANEYRDAPLLIGHTILGRFGSPSESGSADSWNYNVIWIFLGVVGATLVGVIVLLFWYRYQDRRIHHRLRASRDTGFVPPDEASPD